jgi:hypothetical protein
VIGTLLLATTSTAQAERRLTGLDLDVVAGGGPPFNMGGGILLDVRTLRLLQFEVQALAGASLNGKGDGKLGAPVTVAGAGFARLNMLTWESWSRPFVCMERTVGGCWGTYSSPVPRMNALSLEAGGYWGALPFRWVSERTSDFRYVFYPAIGLRWDSFDEQGSFMTDRWSLGVRAHYGPVGAPATPSGGEGLVWGPPGGLDPPVFKGGAWGAVGFGSMVIGNYFAFGLEMGGGAVPPTSSMALWFRVWLGASIPLM